MSLNQPPHNAPPAGYPPPPPFPATPFPATASGPMPPGAPPPYGAPQYPPPLAQPYYAQPQYAPPQYAQPQYNAPPFPPATYAQPQYAPPQPPAQTYGAPPQYAAPQYTLPQLPPLPAPPLARMQPVVTQPPVMQVPPEAPPAPPSPPRSSTLRAPPIPPPLPASPPRVDARRKKKAAGAESEARSEDKPQPPAKSPPLIAQPVAVGDDAAALAAAEREELQNRQRALIAGAVSMIVHLVILITLGLMVAVPKKDRTTGIALEASVEKSDDKLLGEAARIDMTKPETIDAGRPVGDLNMANLFPRLPGPTIPSPGPTIDFPDPHVPGGNNPPGGEMPPGVVHTKPGDGNGATFFDIPATGRKIAFVVDTSGSMFDNQRYERCRKELIESLRTLKPKQYYYVVLFSDRVFPMPGRRLTEATPGNLYRTIAWLNGADPNGTTEPLPALRQALQQRPDAIFLLTDGSFEEGTTEKILKLQTSSKKIPIHTIAFEGQDGEEALKQISRATGGKYRYVQ